MPEVHVIGEVAGASGFNRDNLFCQWKVVTGGDGSWDVVRGDVEGQTQIDSGVTDAFLKYPGDLEIVWNHPINVQFAASSIIGWPKLYAEVWHLDDNGCNELGYGFCHLPANADTEYHLDIVTWAPAGSWYSRLSARLIGGSPQLKDPSIVYKSDDRFELTATSSGSVHVRIQVLHREFEQDGAVF